MKKILHGFMGVLYLGIGSYFLFRPQFGWEANPLLETPFNYIFGSILILYAVFRLWRAIKTKL